VTSPFPQPPELNDTLTVLQLRAQWQLGHMARGESSWSFIMIRNGLVDQPALVWDMWHAALYDLWTRRRPSVWTFTQAVVQDRYPGVRPDLIIPLNAPGGGSSADSAPGQFGPVISWRSVYPGRSYRGRTYWGPVMRDDLEESFVNNACGGDIETWAEIMMDTFAHGFVGETSPQFAIVSRRHNKMPEPIGRFALVDYFMPVRVMGTMRRRLQWWAL
jgi:hypothetical protein